MSWSRSLLLLQGGSLKVISGCLLQSPAKSQIPRIACCMQYALPQQQTRWKSSIPQKDAENLHDEIEMEKKISASLTKMKQGDFDDHVAHPEELTHFKRSQSKGKVSVEAADEPPIGTHALPHPIWNEDEVNKIVITHKKPEKFIDKLAYGSVKLVRVGFDILSGYNRSVRTERIWINRLCFLETVAGVPGMVAAMVRHLDSLRRMRRDHGWIHTLLEEAENERMHLMTFLQLRQPGVLFRGCVMGAQGIFVTFFSFAYMISPKYCHRFVGYLEEEAVRTYTKLLTEDMVHGEMKHWNTMPGPELAIQYWKLKPDASMRDVILAIRADEAHHRVVNHTLGSMSNEDYNPYKPGK